MRLPCRPLLFLALCAISATASWSAMGEVPPSPDGSHSDRPTNLPDLDDLEGLGQGPLKAEPYQFVVDDPVTPTSPSMESFITGSIDDVEPTNLLERPGIPVGWYFGVDLTAAQPRLSTRQQSGDLLSGTFANPVAPSFSSLNWTVMPKFTLGYRRPEGIGELSASYRFLFAQGSDTFIPLGEQFAAQGSSALQMHVLDLDYTLTELFPNDLWLVPRQMRLTGGIRVAGLDNHASNSGGQTLDSSDSNTFIGAGPRFALETVYPITATRWSVVTKIEAAGLYGSDRQKFSQTIVDTDGNLISASAWSDPAVVGVPVIGAQAGLEWMPEWGNGTVKMSGGYRWEQWYYLGTGTSSYNELTIQGPFLRGEVAF